MGKPRIIPTLLILSPNTMWWERNNLSNKQDRSWGRKTFTNEVWNTLCCLSKNGSSMSIPPSCTIHHTSMFPSENCSTLLGKNEMFFATSRAKWAAVVTRTVPREKKERIRISREEALSIAPEMSKFRHKTEETFNAHWASESWERVWKPTDSWAPLPEIPVQLVWEWLQTPFSFISFHCHSGVQPGITCFRQNSRWGERFPQLSHARLMLKNTKGDSWFILLLRYFCCPFY